MTNSLDFLLESRLGGMAPRRWNSHDSWGSIRIFTIRLPITKDFAPWTVFLLSGCHWIPCSFSALGSLHWSLLLQTGRPPEAPTHMKSPGQCPLCWRASPTPLLSIVYSYGHGYAWSPRQCCSPSLWSLAIRDRAKMRDRTASFRSRRAYYHGDDMALPRFDDDWIMSVEEKWEASPFITSYNVVITNAKFNLLLLSGSLNY